MENKELFANNLLSLVEAHLGKGYICEVLPNILKNNGVELLAISIRKNGNCLASTIYLDKYYEMYLDGIASIQEISKTIIENYKDSSFEATKINITSLESKEGVLNNVFFKIVNKKSNVELFNHIYNKDFVGDLSFTFNVMISHDEDNVLSASISYDLMSKYDIGECELFERALENTPKFFPITFKSINEVLGELLGDNSLMIGDSPFYVLSNTRTMYGASTIAYPNSLEMIAKEIGSSFFIIPSSVHECLILVDNGIVDKCSLEEMCREVNNSELRAIDILSYTIYYYDIETMKITCA